MLNIISCYILIRRRNMKKILLCLILGLFLIGFASAANLPNFKMIDGFNDTGDGVFLKYGSNNKVEQTFFILEYNEHDAADYLSNDTAYGYTIYNSTNGTYNFVDKPLKEIGSIELIEFEGKRYIVESWDSLSGNDHDFTDTFNNLVEFNKLNNITPLNATEIIEHELSNLTKRNR